MKCPHCGHKKSRVTDTRARPDADLRYRRCASCNRVFTTLETVCVYVGRQRGWVADQIATPQDFGPPLQAVPDPAPPAQPAAEPAAARVKPAKRYTASLDDPLLAECDPDAQPLLVEWWNVARRSKHGAKATWTEAAWLASIGRVALLPAHQQLALAKAGVEHGWQALKIDYLDGSGSRVTPLPTATGRPMPKDPAMLAALEQWPA